MPADSIGAALSKDVGTRDAISSELRFVQRNGRFILQQLWVIYHHQVGAPDLPYKRETEWRDVPLVVE